MHSKVPAKERSSWHRAKSQTLMVVSSEQEQNLRSVLEKLSCHSRGRSPTLHKWVTHVKQLSFTIFAQQCWACHCSTPSSILYFPANSKFLPCFCFSKSDWIHYEPSGFPSQEFSKRTEQFPQSKDCRFVRYKVHLRSRTASLWAVLLAFTLFILGCQYLHVCITRNTDLINDKEQYLS